MGKSGASCAFQISRRQEKLIKSYSSAKKSFFFRLFDPFIPHSAIVSFSPFFAAVWRLSRPRAAVWRRQWNWQKQEDEKGVKERDKKENDFFVFLISDRGSIFNLWIAWGLKKFIYNLSDFADLINYIEQVAFFARRRLCILSFQIWELPAHQIT